MAQNFRRYIARNVGTSSVTLHTANSYDTLIGIAVANTTSSEIKVDVFINDGSNNYYLIKSAPIQSGGTLQIIDGGAKYVIQSADIVKVVSNTASSCDVWVSAVDAISD
tara:strand:- start:232 stop:558 length:327 start_codon:yes stop_codon:yes gene_type:complete